MASRRELGVERVDGRLVGVVGDADEDGSLALAWDATLRSHRGVREATGRVIWAHERADYGRCVAVARAGLGEAAFAAAWAEGRAMSLDQACAAAIDEGTSQVAETERES